MTKICSREGFGLIHQLASVESDTRRKLQEARHEIYCSLQSLEDEDTSEVHKQLRDSLQKSLNLIADVIGD